MMQVFVFIGFFISSLVCAAERPADYAYGLRVDASGAEALYDVTLPPSVYQGVTRRDLGDVRVFNGAGEVVPHAWRTRRTQTTEAGASVALTLFPLKATAGASIDGLRMSVRRDANGAVAVDVKSDAGALTSQSASQSEIAGYLIDLTKQERALHAISFDWNSADGFNGKLRIDGSDDLASWRTLVSGAPLVSLDVAGQRLQQKRVELPAQKVKYLRLSWANNSDDAKTKPPLLTAANGELTDIMVEAPRSWSKFNAAAGEKPGEYVFDLKGQFPVDRLRLELPDVNTIVQVEVSARDKADQPWRSVTRGVVYRMKQAGSEIVSPDLSVGVTAERHWQIRIDQRGGGLGSGMPVLAVGWAPHQLVFAARGGPPFTLAYGNRAAQPNALAIASLIPGYTEDTATKIAAAKVGEQTINVQAASAQAQKELGGEARLQEQIDWKRWSLWGVLGLGVLVLGVMAWRLMKQLGNTDQS